LKALGLAEKIGAKGQAAQSQLALALLDLEEARAAEAEPAHPRCACRFL